jgi:hypothetical protein
MYTDEDYQSEKKMMSKEEKMIQERFEQMINIIILYKQENREKDVFLTEKCINDAVKYYQRTLSPLLNNLTI